MHVGINRDTECEGSRFPPAESYPVETDRPLKMSDVSRSTGIAVHRLRRWIEGGYISTISRKDGVAQAYLIPKEEIQVAVIMDRLLSGGLNDLGMVAQIARKHLEEVDILRMMGHTGDSIATEHTIGEGLVLTIS